MDSHVGKMMADFFNRVDPQRHADPKQQRIMEQCFIAGMINAYRFIESTADESDDEQAAKRLHLFAKDLMSEYLRLADVMTTSGDH